MFCDNIFTNTDLQNHKENHMKKSPKRFHQLNRALFLRLSNEFEDQKLIPKISPKKIWSAPCFPKIVCGGGDTAVCLYIYFKGVISELQIIGYTGVFLVDQDPANISSV